MKSISRRTFLRGSALGFGAAVLSTGLSGCFWEDEEEVRRPPRELAFEHGVASGDPLQNALILWTRLTPLDGIETGFFVAWEVARDAEFRDLVRSGRAAVTKDTDYTLKVDAVGLDPGTVYYYRFRTREGLVSPLGRGRTLPEGVVNQVRLGVVSCSNYSAGYFNVYEALAREPSLDAIVHLGDYIYEYAEGVYPPASETVRPLPETNNTELLSLDHYRARYALYRRDPSLQKLHAAAPFIVVWDDHEVANDAWREGAENHQPAEGDYLQRKEDALQAWFEWLPVRPASADDQQTIYRRFQFGDLVDLFMLDTRHIGRDPGLNYADFLTGEGLNAAALYAELLDPNRTLLGAEQLGWLQTEIANSSTTWQVLGQQVLMGRMELPAELLAAIASGDLLELAVQVEELAIIKARLLSGDPTVSAAERARVETTLPYNLDAWDGYPTEREAVLQSLLTAASNPVVLAGDTHNAWANELRSSEGDRVGVELATASVTSPGLESALSVPVGGESGLEQALEILIEDLKYSNLRQRGYLTVNFTPTIARADWRYVSSVSSETYSLDQFRQASAAVRAGERRLGDIES